MNTRRREGGLTGEEKRIVKALLAAGMRNQDIQALVNTGRDATINGARITGVKRDQSVRPASEDEVLFYKKKKQSYDWQTGLNLYDDEGLIRAREAMIVAVQIFNSPSCRFKTEIFAVLANIAWTYLLHAYYDHINVKLVGADGRLLLLSQMLARHDCPLSSGVKRNLTTMKEIRDEVEHLILRRADLKWSPLFQACCLNFDEFLVRQFGERLSLQKELSLALQFAKMDVDQITSLQKFDIPEEIEALDARLQRHMSEEELADLNRLGDWEIAAMIDLVTGNKPLPASIRLDIIERTDGIPLFVEEMTKAVLEAEGEGEARRTAAAVPSPALAVPASLHASLMARLDRLGPAKEVAQIGAAIGREFSHALLAAVVRKPDTELGALLDRLIAAGLLFRQGVPPHSSYLFKHALVQDAAYGTLLREPRRALHARIAESLESQFVEIAESQPELLARHCTEAGMIEKAIGLWGKAGQRSLARSALIEAVEQFRRALDLIATLPSTPELRREQIRLQVALANALMHVKGHAALETKAATERAHVLIEQADALGEPPEDPLLLFLVLYGFWTASYIAFNGDVMRNLGAQFLALAEKQRATVPLMIGHRMMGMSLACTGDIAEGRAHFDQALVLYEPAEHRPLATRFGQDVGVAILSNRSLALWLLGYPTLRSRTQTTRSTMRAIAATPSR